MLHVGILPHHDRWGDVLSNLRYVVVDEAHVYRGVFGSHVGNVLRRLRRLARVYGAEPQFLLASATIANPGELAQSLLGVDVTVVGTDAAPRAERTVALWNPPLLDEELGQRASAIGEATRLYAALVSRGLRTICFAKSRRSAELIHRFTAARVEPATAKRLAPYCAGCPSSDARSGRPSKASPRRRGDDAGTRHRHRPVGLPISVGFPNGRAAARSGAGRLPR
jgi:DEAD/DEAH box helicase domain-containing protein